MRKSQKVDYVVLDAMFSVGQEFQHVLRLYNILYIISLLRKVHCHFGPYDTTKTTLNIYQKFYPFF